MMTTDAARELVEECWVSHCWIYADNHLIQGDQASENIDWETVSQIRILPALVSDSTLSPHVGDEE